MEWILNCYFNNHYYIIIVHVVDLVIIIIIIIIIIANLASEYKCNVRYINNQLIKSVKVSIVAALTVLTRSLFHRVIVDGKKLNL